MTSTDPVCHWGGCRMKKGVVGGLEFWVCTVHCCEVLRVGKNP